MRTLLAILVFLGGLSAVAPGAEAARRSWHSVNAAYNAVPPRNARRARAVCEERARFFDPNGVFRGAPCWARSAFGQGRR